MSISETKMKIVIDNYFKAECNMNTSIREAFEKGFKIGVQKGYEVTKEPERKIIYCKDCKFAHLTINGEVKYCDVWFPETKTYLSADNFCSYAEKRGE